MSAIDYDEGLFSRLDDDSDINSTQINNNRKDYIKESEVNDVTYSHPHAAQNTNVIAQTPQQPATNKDEKLLSEMREELKYLRNIVENRFFDLEWANYSNSNPINAEIIKRLLNCGVSTKLAREVVRELPYTDKPETAWEEAIQKMGARLHLVNEDIVDKGGASHILPPTSPQS